MLPVPLGPCPLDFKILAASRASIIMSLRTMITGTGAGAGAGTGAGPSVAADTSTGAGAGAGAGTIPHGQGLLLLRLGRLPHPGGLLQVPHEPVQVVGAHLVVAQADVVELLVCPDGLPPPGLPAVGEQDLVAAQGELHNVPGVLVEGEQSLPSALKS